MDFSVYNVYMIMAYCKRTTTKWLVRVRFRRLVFMESSEVKTSHAHLSDIICLYAV